MTMPMSRSIKHWGTLLWMKSSSNMIFVFLPILAICLVLELSYLAAIVILNHNARFYFYWMLGFSLSRFCFFPTLSFFTSFPRILQPFSVCLLQILLDLTRLWYAYLLLVRRILVLCMWSYWMAYNWLVWFAIIGLFELGILLFDLNHVKNFCCRKLICSVLILVLCILLEGNPEICEIVD